MHKFFKKQDLVEFVFHEVGLLSEPLLASVGMLRTPLAIMKHFSASGENSVVAAFRSGCQTFGDCFESTFTLPVAEYRDKETHCVRARALIDFLWVVWSGACDEDIMDLCANDMQLASPAFLWHRYLNESPKEIGAKYRAFVDSCSAGPILPTPAGPSIMGASELDEEAQQDLRQVQEVLLALRRKTVSFVSLPSVGGASGAEYSKAQMEKVWEGMRLGHRFARKKTDVRAFVFSADLFPPNVAKHGVSTSISEPIAADAERMKRAIDFMLAKRTKDDIILLFDGRSRPCRKVIEQFEEKFAGSGTHAVHECWFVFALPQKTQDPRVPGKQTLFANNNKEVAICVSAAKKAGSGSRIFQRAEFNNCGEVSTASSTYTGVPARRYCELPRMDCDTKATILGVAASGAAKGRRAQKDIDEKGHPFSHCELKPLSLWQRVCEHHQVTHIVDFAAGSGALAVASAGAMEYEGIAANEAHRDWLDSTLDRVITYLAGRDKDLAKKLGGDDDFVRKVEKYFAGTMMDARRLLEPEGGAEERIGDDEGSDEDSGSD